MRGRFGAVGRASAEPEQLRRGSGSAEVAAPALLRPPQPSPPPGERAAYCLSPRPRCGAAPASPGGEPGHRTVRALLELGGVGGSFAVRGGARRGSRAAPGGGRGLLGCGRGARGLGCRARGIAPGSPRLSPGSPITHCLPGAAARLAVSQPNPGAASAPGPGARPVPPGCDGPFPRASPAGPDLRRLRPERGPQSPPAPGSCGCSAGPTGPGAGEQVPEDLRSGSRGLRRAVNTPGRAGLAGRPACSRGAAGAPARVGDVQPWGTRLGLWPGSALVEFKCSQTLKPKNTFFFFGKYHLLNPFSFPPSPPHQSQPVG